MLTAFISYGGPDEVFASRLNKYLISSGIKTFFFPSDAKPGIKLHHIMRDGVNNYDKIIFVCSKNSLNRPGVINELEESLQREAREGGKEILIPITLDNYLFKGWNPERKGLKQTILDRVVANFKRTKTNEENFANACSKLIQALEGGPEITYISWKHSLFLEPSGKRCLSIIENKFIPHNPLTEIIYSGLRATGHIIAGATSLGETKAIAEGGNFSIYTKLNEPLPLNELITHTFEISFINSFTETTEDCSFLSKFNWERVSIDIHFPPERRFKNASLKCIRRAVKILDNLETDDRCEIIKLTLKNPPIGDEYLITWDW